MLKNIDLHSTSIGIELGSTRIKSVLVDKLGKCLSTGVAEWENELNEEGYWTYSEDLIWKTLQKSYSDLKENFYKKYNEKLYTTGSIGISAMMHGLMAFDDKGQLLTPFRTWRNNNTKESSRLLSNLFSFNIPERWSISHIYQSILDQESYIKDLNYITTLSGYINWKLTDKKNIGIGDAAGMFPIDSSINNYDLDKIKKFDEILEKENIKWRTLEILPEILVAGKCSGKLTEKGRQLLDPEGDLSGEIFFAPPEGDAGTGMVATNCINERQANISLGTSAFSMIVLEKELDNYYKDIDIVQTPSGKTVAMIHVNNCTSDINSWVNFIKDLLLSFGVDLENIDLYKKLFEKSKQSDERLGNLVSYGFHSGENIFDINKGMPILIREQENDFNLANLMKSVLVSSLVPLKYGHDVLNKYENVKIDKVIAHGGILKTKNIAQEIISEILDTEVNTYETASEGGAWGMALLALYTKFYNDEKLDYFLNNRIFNSIEEYKIERNKKLKKEIDNYLLRYDNYLKDVRKLINEN